MAAPPLHADEWDAVVLQANAFRVVIPPDRTGTEPGNFDSERAALRKWLRYESFDLGFNAVRYGMDEDYFKKVHPTANPCLRSVTPFCPSGTWPAPSSRGDLFTFDEDLNAGWLNDLEPFAFQDTPGLEPVTAWLNARRLNDPLDWRLCPEDPNRVAHLAGTLGDPCACAFSYSEVVRYLADELAYMRDRADEVEEGLFKKVMRGMHLNLETYAFPRVHYPAGAQAGGGYPRLEAQPGVCAKTATAFNNEDWDGDFIPDRRHLIGGVSDPEDEVTDLDAALADAEFNYPVKKWETLGPASGTFGFGSTGRAAISQTLLLDTDDDRVTRIDVKLARTQALFPKSPLYAFLAATRSDGSPDLGEAITTTRPTRPVWIPHENHPGRPEWIAFYVDPGEAATLFSPGQSVAFVLYTPALTASDPYGIEHEPPLGIPAFAIDSGNQDPPAVGPEKMTELDGTLELRVWYAPVMAHSAHDDWVVFQNRRIGRLMKDINVEVFDRVAGGEPGFDLQLWPFTHVPTSRNRHILNREYYGTDISENHRGEGTSAQLHGVQVGFVGDLQSVHRVYADRVMPTMRCINDDENDPPNHSYADIHNTSKWSFAFGGLGVFQLGYANTGGNYYGWRETELPKVRAYTAPVRLFPDHYRWVNMANVPDSTVTGDLYMLSSWCPAPDCAIGKYGAGHLLIANDGSSDADVDPFVEARELGWVRARTDPPNEVGPFIVDELTVHLQQERAEEDPIETDRYVTCDSLANLDDLVTLEPRPRTGDTHLGSILVARYRTMPVQPGDVMKNYPRAAGYCSDQVLDIRWMRVPTVCLEQRSIADVAVRLSLQVQRNGIDWQHAETIAYYAPDTGRFEHDLCGGSPPSCYSEDYGKPWRVRLDLQARKEGGSQYFDANLAYSNTFTVYDESAPGGCAVGGCPYIGGTTIGGHQLDNNILAYSGDGSHVVDHYRLRFRPTLIDSTYYLTLTEAAADFSLIDSVAVLVLDHAPATRVAVSHDGTIYGYESVRPVVEAIDSGANDVTELLAAEDDTSNVHLSSGEFVTLELGVAEPTSALYVVSDIKHSIVPAPLSVLVQVPDETLGWTTVKRLEPRDKWGEDVVPMETLGYASGDSVRVRLFWTEDHKVDFVGLLTGTGAVEVSVAPLGRAYHTALGDVTADLSSSASVSTPMVTGDVILMDFPALPVAPGKTRDLVFVSSGRWTGEGMLPPPPARQAQRGTPEAPALHVLGPRPSRGPATMKIELPGSRHVAVRIFDVQGRLVRTVVDERLTLGHHVVTWDRRDDGARRVGRGVYFAQLRVAGARPLVEKLHVLD